MTRLIYQIEDRLYFDQKAFYAWAERLGLIDEGKYKDVLIERIDRNGLLQIS